MNEKETRLALIPIGDVVSETFKTVFKNITALGVVVITGVAIAAIGFFLAGNSLGLGVINQILSFIVSMIIVGFLVLIVKDSGNDSPSSISEKLSLVSPNLVSLLVSTFIKVILVSLGLLLFIFPGIYLLIRLSMSESAIVNEGLGPINGLKRSFEITKDISLRIFLIYLIISLIIFGFFIASFFFFVFINIVLSGLILVGAPSSIVLIAGVLVFIPVLSFIYAISIIWIPVVYFRLESRSEQDQEN